MIDIGKVGVFLGLDIGKSTHHGHGLTPTGKKARDKFCRTANRSCGPLSTSSASVLDAEQASSTTTRPFESI